MEVTVEQKADELIGGSVGQMVVSECVSRSTKPTHGFLH